MGRNRQGDLRVSEGVSAPARSIGFRAMEVAFIGAFVVLAGCVGWDVVRGFAARPALAWLIPFVVLGALVASDFASGFVHWLADTYATSETPFVGPKFVAPFREHHRDPLAITRHGFVEANGDNCGITLLVLVPTHVFIPAAHGGGATIMALFVVLLASFTVVTSMAHGWAHAPEPPRFAQILQRVGLLLSPEHHAGHHEAPHRDRYCITTGWLNPLLDATKFFRRMEALFARLGIRPALHYDFQSEGEGSASRLR